MAAPSSAAMNRWTVETILPKLRAANAPMVSRSVFLWMIFLVLIDLFQNTYGIHVASSAPLRNESCPGFDPCGNFLALR